MTYTPDAIRNLRHALGLTQVGFAARLGVSPTIVSRWETGIYSPGSLSKVKLNAIVAHQAAKAVHIAYIVRHQPPAPLPGGQSNAKPPDTSGGATLSVQAPLAAKPTQDTSFSRQPAACRLPANRGACLPPSSGSPGCTSGTRPPSRSTYSRPQALHNHSPASWSFHRSAAQCEQSQQPIIMASPYAAP